VTYIVAEGVIRAGKPPAARAAYTPGPDMRLTPGATLDLLLVPVGLTQHLHALAAVRLPVPASTTAPTMQIGINGTVVTDRYVNGDVGGPQRQHFNCRHTTCNRHTPTSPWESLIAGLNRQCVGQALLLLPHPATPPRPPGPPDCLRRAPRCGTASRLHAAPARCPRPRGQPIR